MIMTMTIMTHYV